jgi:hypothetical protein
MKDKNAILKCLLIAFLVIIPSLYDSVVSLYKVGGIHSLALNAYFSISLLIQSSKIGFPVLLLLYFEKDSYKEYGFKKIIIKELFISLLRMLGYFLLFAIIISIAGGIIIVILSSFGFLKSFTDQIQNQVIRINNNHFSLILLNIIPIAFAAFVEELCFRSFLYINLNRIIVNKIKCIVIISILFSICHIYQGLFGIVQTFVLGMTLGFEFKRSKNIFLISIFHLIFNIVAFV